LLFGDDELHVLRRHRLDVRAVGELRIGHDGRRIGVDEDDLEPFFLERLRRLRPRIVELGALPDYDRAGANDQDAVDVGALRHAVSPGSLTKGSKWLRPGTKPLNYN